MDDSKGNNVLFRGAQLKIKDGVVIAQENTAVPINEGLRNVIGSKSFNTLDDALKDLQTDLKRLARNGV